MFVIAVGAATGVLAMPAAADLPVVRVHGGDRYLETSDGNPFFWLADTAWQLQRLDPSEVDAYLANRAAKGFTVIQGPVLLGGDPNFQGETNDSPGNPNPDWFDHIDHIINRAAAHGLYVAPVLSHGSHEAALNTGSAYSFGEYVGNRYRNRTNIAAFVVSSEYNHPEPNLALWNAMADGVLDGLAGTPRLLTIHPKWSGGFDGQTSSADFHDSSWLSFNMIQSSIYGDCTNDPGNWRYLGVHNWMLMEHDYGLSPAKPTVDAEATYEMLNPDHPSCDFNQERWNAYGVRRRAYWSVFAGGIGHTYGANGVFQFHQQDDPNWVWGPVDYWDDAIDYPGAAQMGFMRSLLESRPFFTRIPDQDLLWSEPSDLVPEHVHATRDAAGRYGMVYVPEPDRTVVIDATRLNATTVRAWWFDPRTGLAEMLNEFDPSDVPGGVVAFTSPDEGEDWVLVLDDVAQGYGPPGSDDPPSVPGDVDGDGDVDVDDLVIVLGSWGACPACPADLNGDGEVAVEDLLIVLEHMAG
jgi:hypothetical protein